MGFSPLRSTFNAVLINLVALVFGIDLFSGSVAILLHREHDGHIRLANIFTDAPSLETILQLFLALLVSQIEKLVVKGDKSKRSAFLRDLKFVLLGRNINYVFARYLIFQIQSNKPLPPSVPIGV